MLFQDRPQPAGSDGALKIAMIGTRGVPARYGGFETCIEEVGRRLADRGHEVTVYCRYVEGESSTNVPSTYLGMKLVHLPAMRKRSLETLSHTALSVFHAFRHRPDAAIVFNCANAPFLPVLRAARVPLATHVDGLEWRRAKWGPAGQRYYKMAERLSVRWSDGLIADAAGIQDYYQESYGVPSTLISYGAPLVAKDDSRLHELDLRSGGYHLVVSRFEPENHVLEIVQGYTRSNAKLPLVVVGSAPYSEEYTTSIREAADSRVRLLGGVWDQELLDQLYSNARTYLHGHSVGGTNPSLLRAIGAGAPTDAFDVVFNREVLGAAGRFFTSPSDVAVLVETAESDVQASVARGDASRERAKLYDWELVADGYEQLCFDLAQSTSRPPSNHRAAAPVARST